MGKIKILMVMGSTNMGGAQIFVLNLLRNLDLDKYLVDFVVNFEERNSGISNELRELGCHIYKLPYFKVYNYLAYIRIWNRFFSRHRYDIVHGHSTNSASLYLKIAKQYGSVTIAHCHSAGFRGNLISRIIKSFYKKGVREQADYWFACSSNAAEHLYGKSYLTYKKYFHIPNAIEVSNYLYNQGTARRIRMEIGISDDTFLCGHVGSFTTPKNHMYLLEIFREVIKIRPNSKLICCGDGPLVQQVKDKVNSLGLNNYVIMPGVVNNINEFLMAMDVFVFPSLFEGFPISVLEAQSAGLPIIMSNVISTDVDLTANINRLSLKSKPKEWAEIICKQRNIQRQDANGIIENSIYNARSSAERMMELYDEMTRYRF